jgi:hypothetical protein
MTTLILKEVIDQTRLDQALRDLGFVEHDVPPVEDMFRRLWMSKDEKSAVNYIDDSLSEVCYLLVRGKRKETISETLRTSFPIWERDDLLKHALFLLIDGSEDDVSRVAMEVSAEMEEYDAASAGVLSTFLKMDEESTRLAGARALRLRPWPIFYDTAQELANDSNPEIASVGATMLARIIELHGE